MRSSVLSSVTKPEDVNVLVSADVSVRVSVVVSVEGSVVVRVRVNAEENRLDWDFDPLDPAVKNASSDMDVALSDARLCAFSLPLPTLGGGDM